MQIKIEIDVKPEELRRFLGLPDVAGLQEDVVRFLREKVTTAGEGFDPAAMVQTSLDLIRNNPTWRMFRKGWGPRDRSEADAVIDDEVPTAAPRTPRPRKTAAARQAQHRAPAKKRAKRATKKTPNTDF